MEIKATCWSAVLSLSFVTVVSSVTVQYLAEGGTLVLRPPPVRDQIWSVLWKYGDDYVAEWIKDAVDLTYYPDFNGRTELDRTSGYLQIARATEADSGVFSLEINGAVQADTYEVRVIRRVPEPNLWMKPGPTPNTYLLYCDPVPESTVKAAEPISYRWKIGTGEWVEFGNKVEINVNETTVQAETFTCQMVNPVSEKTSKPKENPFYRAGPSGHGLAAGIVVGLVALIGVCYCAFAYKKNKFPFHRTGNAPVSPSEHKPEEDELNAEPGIVPA